MGNNEYEIAFKWSLFIKNSEHLNLSFLERECNFSKGTLNHVKNGSRLLTIDQAYEICKAMMKIQFQLAPLFKDFIDYVEGRKKIIDDFKRINDKIIKSN